MKQTFLLSSAITALLLPTLVFAADEPILIKSPTSPAVYLVQDGSRHPFPLQKIYESWYGTTFKNVLSVSAEALAAYPLGKNVKFKQGSLIKIQTDPKVYLVTDSAGHLEWIKTEDEFKARGLSFKEVRDVPDAFFPDYSLAPPQNNFATPEQGTSTTSTPPTQTTSSTPPTVVLQPLAIQSVSSTAALVENRSKITYTITSSAPALLTITYQALGSAQVKKEFETATTFSGTIEAGLGEAVPYSIEIKANSNNAKLTGVFNGYSDFTVSPATELVPVSKPLIRPDVRLGAFNIVNNSADVRPVRTMSFIFTAGNYATDDVNKTLELRRITSSGTLVNTLGTITRLSNTSIAGVSNMQTFAINESLAPGEMRTYEIIGRNFEALNAARYNETDVFTTQIERIESGGYPTIIYLEKKIGTLLFKK